MASAGSIQSHVRHFANSRNASKRRFITCLAAFQLALERRIALGEPHFVAHLDQGEMFTLLDREPIQHILWNDDSKELPILRILRRSSWTPSVAT